MWVNGISSRILTWEMRTLWYRVPENRTCYRKESHVAVHVMSTNSSVGR